MVNVSIRIDLLFNILLLIGLTSVDCEFFNQREMRLNFELN